MRKVNAVLTTNGNGYWSNVAKDVKVIGLELAYVSDEQDFGELCVFFDTASWDVNTDGLIYSDKQFKRDLRALLNQLGLRGDDVDYSEQGMQGDNYVSCDVGAKFIQSFTSEMSNLLA